MLANATPHLVLPGLSWCGCDTAGAETKADDLVLVNFAFIITKLCHVHLGMSICFHITLDVWMV